MKVKHKTVKCQVCDTEQPDKSEYPNIRAGHGHTMIVVSVWDEEKEKRRYMDFCSIKCLRDWSNARSVPSTELLDGLAEMRERLGRLSEKDACLIRLRFGLRDGYLRTYKEIAKQFRITESWARIQTDRAVQRIGGWPRVFIIPSNDQALPQGGAKKGNDEH